MILYDVLMALYI